MNRVEEKSGPVLGPEFFAKRRETLFEAIGEGSIAVVAAAPPSGNYARFRQDRAFYYLTGFPEPSAVAVFRRVESSREYVLFVPPRDPDRERWDGLRAGTEGAQERYGADRAFSLEELDHELPRLFEGTSRAYLLPDFESESGRRLYQAYRQAAVSNRRVGHGAYELRDLGYLLALMRVRKQPEEIAMIRHAATITREAYLEAIAAIRPGAYEYQIEAILNAGFRKRGGDGPAYTTIVGGGENATILHYVENSQPLRDGELLLIDAAASYGCYAADVTRTYPINGRFTEPQRRVYETVLSVQKTVLAAVRPGVSIRELHRIAAVEFIQAMQRFGWLSPDEPPEKLFEQEAHKKCFMHGIGHYLGLDVHDVGPTEVDGKPYPLEPGMVLTIEPGWYISSGTEGVPEAFWGIGVRIEDDVLVTETGGEVLTPGIPKEIEEIEALMGNRSV